MRLTEQALSDEQIRELDAKYCSFGDTVHYSKDPKIFRDCEGSFMYDAKGTPFLDLQMWYASCNLGYKNERVSKGVIKQIKTLPQVASRFLYDYKVLLAEKIALAAEERFGQKGRVHFNVGGAQASEDALKLIRNYTGKNLMFAFMGGYHGRTLGTTSITAGYRYRENYGHFGNRAHFVPYPYCFRCHYEKERGECDFYCVKQFEKLFESECQGVYNPKTGNSEFAAFFAEPLQGTGGYINPPKGYFRELKRVLDKYGILFAADEIQMGFYRTGKLFSIEHFDVVPDIITFGKSLTNGLNPLSGFWAKEKLVNPDVWPSGMTHSTYSSNPIGTRAGYEVMSIFEESNWEKDVLAKGEYFLERLEALKKKYPLIGHVDGLGLALRIECCEQDGFTPNRKLCDALQEEGLKGDLTYKGKNCGLVLNNGGYFKNVITLVPALTISYEEIDMAADLLNQLFARF